MIRQRPIRSFEKRRISILKVLAFTIGSIPLTYLLLVLFSHISRCFVSYTAKDLLLSYEKKAPLSSDEEKDPFLSDRDKDPLLLMEELLKEDDATLLLKLSLLQEEGASSLLEEKDPGLSDEEDPSPLLEEDPLPDLRGVLFLTVSVYLSPVLGFLSCSIYVWRSNVKIRRLAIELGFCQACSYNLRDNVQGTCPECGTPIPDETKKKLVTKQAAASVPH